MTEADAKPAPVPEIVAIPRATEAEVAQAQELLAKFKESDPAAKALLEKYPDLLVIQPPRENSATVPSLSGGFAARLEQHKALAQAGDIELLLVGDSITDGWDSENGDNPAIAVLKKYFGGVKVGNFGIGGDTTQGVLYRLRNGEGTGFQPKAIMVMIGTNNTARNTAAEIAEGNGAIVAELRKDFPNAKILLLGIFPRNAANAPVREQIKEINSKIAKLDDGRHVFYMDIGHVFLDSAGNIPQNIMPDGLHPSTEGYVLWAEAVDDKLAELMGVPSTHAPAAAAQ